MVRRAYIHFGFSEKAYRHTCIFGGSRLFRNLLMGGFLVLGEHRVNGTRAIIREHKWTGVLLLKAEFDSVYKMTICI